MRKRIMPAFKYLFTGINPIKNVWKLQQLPSREHEALRQVRSYLLRENYEGAIKYLAGHIHFFEEDFGEFIPDKNTYLD